MLHDDERGRRGARVGAGPFDHQKALTVGRPIVGVVSLYTTPVPSGVIPLRNWAWLLVVSRSAAAVPSAACHQRLGWPSWFELKMIRRPSGVHRGNWSWPGSSVRRVSVARP